MQSPWSVRVALPGWSTAASAAGLEAPRYLPAGDPPPPRPPRAVGVERRRALAGSGRPAAQRRSERSRRGRGRRRAVDGVAAVYSSDLVRARRTAEILARRLGALDPVVDARLRERHAGAGRDCTRAEIEAGWPGYLESGRRPDGYEPDESVLARALDALGADRRRPRRRRARRDPRRRRAHPRATPGRSERPTPVSPTSAGAGSGTTSRRPVAGRPGRAPRRRPGHAARADLTVRRTGARSRRRLVSSPSRRTVS